MKRILTLALLGLFIAGGAIGCSASGELGDDDDDTVRSSKTTTRIEPDGDRKTVKTETKVTRED